jgi:glutaredoxin
MKLITCLFLTLTATATALPAQSLYKWVDAQGKISYSDQPPPPALEVKDLSKTVNTLGAGLAQNEPLPFDTQQLVARSPVVIYTSKGCGPCESGRNLLRGKGIPFTEKTVDNTDDLKALGAQFNAQTLPVLTVGKKSINGFGASQWSDTLAEAGFNESTAVPKTYVNGAASPLTEPVKPVAVAKKPVEPKADVEPIRRRAAAPATPPPEPLIKF